VEVDPGEELVESWLDLAIVVPMVRQTVLVGMLADVCLVDEVLHSRRVDLRLIDL